jgi:phosphopantetheine--protein transferase-like protein
MLIGIGIDSIEIARVGAKCADGSTRFMEKMFTPHEIARSLRNVRSPYQHLAACFAAREAFFKATQVWYMRANVSIAQRPSGEPYYVHTERITGQLRQLYGRVPRILVSLTHDEEYATAFAVCEAAEQ